MSDHEYLAADGVSTILRRRPDVLARDRIQPDYDGPPCVKVGRRVLLLRAGLDAWLGARMVGNTDSAA